MSLRQEQPVPFTYEKPTDNSGYSTPISVVIGTARVKGTPLFLDSIRPGRVMLPDATDPTLWTEQDGKVVTAVLGLCEGPIPPQSQTNLVWFDKWAGSRIEAAKRIVAGIGLGSGSSYMFYLGGTNVAFASVGGLLQGTARRYSTAGVIQEGDMVYLSGPKRTGWITKVQREVWNAGLGGYTDVVSTSVPLATNEVSTMGVLSIYRAIEVDAGSRTGSDFYTTTGYSTFRYTAINNSGSASVLTMKSDSAVPLAGDYIYYPIAGVGDFVASVTGGTTVTMASKKSWPTPSGYAAADLYTVAQGVTWDTGTRSGTVHFAGTATARSRAWVTSDGKVDNLEFEVTGQAASQPTSVERPKTVCSPTASKTPTQITVVTGGGNVTALTLGSGETYNLSVGDKLTQGSTSSTIYALNHATGVVTLSTSGTWTTGVAEVTVPRSVLDAHPADAVVAILTDPVWGLGWDAAQVDVDHGADGQAASSFRTYATALGFRISGVLDSARSAKEIVKSLLEACNAVPVETTISGAPAIRVIPWGDDAVTANGVTYTPPTASPYPVNETHLVRDGDGPVLRIERGSRADIPNVCPVSFRDREKDYDQVTVEYMDAARVEDDGRVKRASALDLAWTIPSVQAMAISQALVQRAAALANTLTFTLPPTYAFLECMDFLSLSSDLAGYSGTTIRVTALDEDEGGQLVVTACEWPLGIGRTAIHEKPVVDGTGSSGGARQSIPPDNSAAIAALQDAVGSLAAADGGIVSYWQSSAPASAGEGDLWFDTDDNNKVYRWTSGAWVSAQDSRIAQAVSDAATALGTADGKSTIWYQASAPGGLGATDQGDLWVDTDGNLKVYAWTGSAWVLAQDWYTANATANNAWAAVQDMTSDGKLTPAEKPAFFNAVVTIWNSVKAAGSTAGGALPLNNPTDLDSAAYSFSNYLYGLGFDYQWSDIDGQWAVPAARTTQRGLLSAWMATTTTVDGVALRDAVSTINAAISTASAGGLTSAQLRTTIGAGTSATADTVALRDSSAALTATDFVSTSDARLKRRVSTITGALDKVLALRGVTFERLDDRTGARRMGLIAQEVREVAPEVVKEGQDGYLTVAYGSLVSLLIEAVRELAARED